MQKKLFLTILVVLILILSTAAVVSADPLSTSTFTYQGQLSYMSELADGSFDFQFSLYSASSGGTQIGSTNSLSGVTVSEGLFTVQLDFGSSAFDGNTRWLEIGVRPSGGGAYTTLAPRQEITPTPYAVFSGSAESANTAANAANAVNFSGSLNGDVSGTQAATVVEALRGYNLASTAPADGQALVWNNTTSAWEPSSISGDNWGAQVIASGSWLAGDGTAANPLSLAQNGAADGQTIVWNNTTSAWEPTTLSVTGTHWTLAGNSGTTFGTDFIGTTDNTALDFRVNNASVLRLIPNADSPNILGGYLGNSIDAGLYGSVISGGGDAGNINIITGSGNYAAIGGGRGNTSSASHATVGGGGSNTASQFASTVGGGWYNNATGSYTTVGGGFMNTASNLISTVGGGYSNNASGDYAIVGGGWTNTASGLYATVGGGDTNTASGEYATVGGGDTNAASGLYATVSGGVSNNTSGDYATIGGGLGNNASYNYATIGGGDTNSASDYYATVGGGQDNTASGDYATAAGGLLNNSSQSYATVSGGWNNNASANSTTVGGGNNNTASGLYASVSGGRENLASGYYSTVPGGRNNTAAGATSFAAGYYATASNQGCFVWSDSSDNAYPVNCTTNHQTIFKSSGGFFIFTTNDLSNGIAFTGSSTLSNIFPTEPTSTLDLHSILRLIPNTTSPNIIGGFSGNSIDAGLYGSVIAGGGDAGQENTITGNGNNATIGGGYDNTARGYTSTISGGSDNFANGDYSTVGGGASNTAIFNFATVGGGYGNTASGDHATVGGGFDNTASGGDSTVGGGWSNTASGDYATVGGGWSNTASGEDSTVGGGYDNTASGNFATVGGGYDNTADGYIATIGGGYDNTASGNFATVGGGQGNVANGNNATVPGGIDNTALGSASFAAGNHATATNQGCFVWSDNSDSTNPVDCTTNYRTIFKSSGGFRIYTSSDLTTGVTLAPGGGSWTSVSDVNKKENFESVDTSEVLQSVLDMPVTTWNYITQEEDIRHIGPMAQDFYAAFGVGETDLGITAIDADGVALAAIQGMYAVVEEKDARISELEAENEDLVARLESIEDYLSESGYTPPTDSTNNFSVTLPWLLLAIVCAAAVGFYLNPQRKAE